MQTRVTLYADKGKVLTDGKTYGRIITLAVGETGDGFYEITEAEYAKVKKEAEEHDLREETDSV